MNATTKLPIIINSTQKHQYNRIIVEMDADRFERVASALGFFNPEFLVSVDRAEREIKAGKVRRLVSLKDLRK
jgi:hypothetical protein